MAEQPEDIHEASANAVQATEPNASETETVVLITQRHEIEHTRQDISATLDALKEKLSPTVLLDQAKEHAKEVAVDALDQAKENVKDNITAKVEDVKDTVGTALHNASDTVSDAVSTAKDKVADVMHNVSGTVTSAVQSAKDKVGDMMGANKDKSGNAGSIDAAVSTIRAGSKPYPTQNTNKTMGGIMDGAKGAGTTVIETIKRNPLPTALIGAGALYLYMQHRDSGTASTYSSSDYDYTDYDAVYTPLDASGDDVLIDNIIIIETDEGIDGISDLSASDYAVSAPNYVPSAPAKTGSNTLIDTIQSNPVPAVLAVLGATWLFMKNRDDNKTPRYNDYSDYVRGGTPVSSKVGDVVDTVKGKAGQVGDSVSDAVNTAKGKVSDTVSSVSDKVSDTVSDAKDKAGDVIDAAKHKASDAADAARHKASDVADAAKSAVSTAKGKAGDAADAAKTAAAAAKDRAVQVTGQARTKVTDLSASALEQTRKAGGAVADTYQANPLAYGLVALGIGAAVGLLVPGTDQENKLMGQTRDQLMTKAQASVQDITTKVQAVAGTTLEQAKTDLSTALDTAKTGLNTTLDTAKTTVMEQAKAQGLTGE